MEIEEIERERERESEREGEREMRLTQSLRRLFKYVSDCVRRFVFRIP